MKNIKLIILFSILFLIYNNYNNNYNNNYKRGGSKNGIPKIIHQIWIGDNMPEHRKLYCSSVKKFAEHYNYKYILWTNKTITSKNFPKTFNLIKEIQKWNGSLSICDYINSKNCHTNKKIKLLNKFLNKVPKSILSSNKLLNIPKLSKYAQIADLMRYEIINNYGGIYFDTNIEIREHKFKEFKLELSKSNFISAQENINIFSQGFFASKKNNPVLIDILNNINSIDYLSKKDNNQSGPGYFRYYIKKNKNYPYLIDSRKIYPYVSWGLNKSKDLTIHNKFKPNTKSINYKGKTYYLSFPCPKNIYPNAYTIDHFEFGKTW